MNDAPKTIYLNIIEDEPFSVANQTGEVTWCEDKQHDYDVKYIRADITCYELAKSFYENATEAELSSLAQDIQNLIENSSCAKKLNAICICEFDDFQTGACPREKN